MRSGSPKHHRHPDPSPRIIDPVSEERHCQGSDVAFYVGSLLVMATLVVMLCAPAYIIGKQFAVDSYTFITGGNPVTLLCFFGATFDGPWPTKLCSHLVYCGAIMGTGEDWLQLDARPGARRAFSTFLALKDTGEDYSLRQPRLVIGVREPPTTLGATDTTDSWPLAFAEQGKAQDLARRAANWLSNRRLDGLAFLEQRLDPGRIDAYVTILKEIRTAFSGKLLLLFSIFWLYDMDNRVKSLFLERRIKELIKLTDFTLLETHVPPHKEGECVTFLPNSFSRTPESNRKTFTMNAVLAWMDRAASQVDQGSVCFTLTLAVMRFLLPLEHTGFGETCQDFYPVSYMQASTLEPPRRILKRNVGLGGLCCATSKHLGYYAVPERFRHHCRLWENVRFDSSSAANYAEVPGKGGMSYHRLEAYDNVASLDIKLESILSQFSRLCVALVHVDFDDYLGVCGHSQGPFARLASAREVLRRFSVTAQFYVDLKRRRRRR
ncbi:hypothetical protein HPB52_019187 [Rhipicephalus sanguineus]|uniref:Uncharacterized protein n=1 Tax=Rhipicephalus sanguineus TaxID=34632 RepID=A0A9D4SUQ8_RHISA|nr:hypothetical protein HPB52_019187 [Rhipicephalus sanguineus]